MTVMPGVVLLMQAQLGAHMAAGHIVALARR
jgi:hypothetical protein